VLTGPRPIPRRDDGVLLVVVALGVALRFLRLDADPHYYDWIGYFTDEGRWIDQARDLALFGRFVEPELPLNALVGPLFQVFSYGVFRLLDVSILTSRLLSAVAGSLLLIAFWLGLRRRVSTGALLVTLIMLAFEGELVVFSRLAVPEMTVMAIHFLVFLAITSSRRRPWTLPLAGLASLVTVGIKVTALPVVAIFALLILMQPRDPSWTGSRWRDVARFLAGLLSPLPVLGVTWVASGSPQVQVIARATALLEAFLSPGSAYGAVAFVFEDPMALVLNLWLLALWGALVGWRAATDVVADSTAHRTLVTSLTWSALYAGVMLLLDYFPNRYKIHVLVPMAVTIAVGLTLLERAGRSGLDALFEGARGVHGVFTRGFLGLPTAVVVAPLLAGVGGLLGGHPERLRMKVACTLLAIGGAALVLAAVRGRSRGPVFLFVFPMTAALMWSTVRRTGLYDVTFWPTHSFLLHAAGWLAILLAAVGFAAAVASAARPGGRGVTSVVAFRLGGLWYLAVCLPALTPVYLTPHYSIRDASRYLATTLTGVTTPIGSSGADGLFREGRLRYRTVWGQTWPAIRPEVIVIVFAFRDPDGWLEREYCLTDALPLYVAPEYFRSYARPRTSALGETVRVYKRRPAGCRLADQAALGEHLDRQRTVEERAVLDDAISVRLVDLGSLHGASSCRGTR
jgi:hypothetical protein